MKWSKLLVALCVAALLLVPITGCQAKVEKDGNKVTVTGKDGEKVETEVQGGENVSLPDGFPEDVPLYKNATLIASSSVASGGQTMYTLGYETPDDVKTVHLWYKGELPKQKWTIEGETLVSASGQSTGGIGAKKGKSQLNVASGRNEGDAKTTISIIVTE